MRQLAPHAAYFARNFYGILFALDPALRPIFRSDMAAQGVRLVQMLAAAVDGLDRFGELVRLLRELGRRHARYGVRQYDFETVGAALLSALARHRGGALDEATLAAWSAAWHLMARELQVGLLEVDLPPTSRPRLACKAP